MDTEQIGYVQYALYNRTKRHSYIIVSSSIENFLQRLTFFFVQRF
jgi:hypothetical protein